MRGKILGVDAASGTGAIAGGDGKRYTFERHEWRGAGDPQPGLYVDFDSSDGATATGLFPEVKTIFQPAGDAPAAAPAAPAFPRDMGTAPPAAPYQPPHADPAPRPAGFAAGGQQPGHPSQAPSAPYPPQGHSQYGYPQGGGAPGYQGQAPMQGGHPGYPPQAHPGQYQKSKIAAGLLALFLGTWGIHKFYLGYTTEGFIMLGATIASFILTFVLIGVFGLMAVGIIALVEAIIYLTKSDEEFDRIYVQHKKAWF